MASPYIHSSIGGSAGADLTTRSPWYSSGVVYYLGNASGGSDSYAGTDRKRPLATLAAAYTAMSAGDTLVVLSGHAESLSSAQTLGKAGLHIYGEGSGTTAPRFTCTGTVAMLDVTAAGVMLENLYFPESTAVPTARVRSASTSTVLKGCTFECGASDTGPAVKFVTGAGAGWLRSCTFESTASSIAAPPGIGVEVANAMSDLWIENCLFDGGDTGWSDYGVKGTAAITRFHGFDVTLLNGADVFFATGSSGRLHVKDPTGSARVVWTA